MKREWVRIPSTGHTWAVEHQGYQWVLEFDPVSVQPRWFLSTVCLSGPPNPLEVVQLRGVAPEGPDTPPTHWAEDFLTSPYLKLPKFRWFDLKRKT
jgi:hypothetical protein